jgi:hypothetical protein
MRAIVKVAVPAVKGQYWNEIRLIPIFGYGYGVKTFSACTDVSSELWQHPVRPWNQGRYGVCVGDTVADSDGAVERDIDLLMVVDGVREGIKIVDPKKYAQSGLWVVYVVV